MNSYKPETYISALTQQDIVNYLAGMEEYVGRQLSHCKLEIIAQVDHAFTLYQKQLIAEITNKYATDSVYDAEECGEVAEYITQEVEKLYSRVVELKGEECLGVLIRQHEVEDAEVARGIQQVEKYIAKNSQAGGINITIAP